MGLALQLLADNQSGKAIADLLSMSPRTVEKHRSNICEKLDVRGSHALLKLALKLRDQIKN